MQKNPRSGRGGGSGEGYPGHMGEYLVEYAGKVSRDVKFGTHLAIL